MLAISHKYKGGSKLINNPFLRLANKVKQLENITREIELELDSLLRVLRKRVIERELKQSVIWRSNKILVFAEDRIFKLLIKSNIKDISLVRVTFSDKNFINSLLKYFEEVFSLEKMKVNYCIIIYQIPNFLLELKSISSDILIGNKFNRKMQKDALQKCLRLLKEQGYKNGLLIAIDDSDITGIDELYKVTSLFTKYNKNAIVLGIGIKQSQNDLAVDVVRLFANFHCD
ncbi:MAG: hypothetical protein ACP6IS_04050 [Candidatus Asgardarchaeia archaeon]